MTQRLRQRREALGLTQQQIVARLAGLGVSTSNRALSSLEHGAGIDVARLPELATALDCTVTFLLGLTNRPERWDPDDVDPTPGRDPGAGPPVSRPKERANLAQAPLGFDPDDRCWILGDHVPDREG
ncbi:MAG: helix-turn-helix transcriptional regulator [Actinomycetota bacterium]|nr:helix-turn-helix transcriptional regulator [Actinomycetota bacterium]